MKKQKNYSNCHFSAETIKEAFSKTDEIAEREEINKLGLILNVNHDDASWDHDSLEEFFSDYRKYKSYAHCATLASNFGLTVIRYKKYTSVSVESSKRSDIESVFDIFEKNVNSSQLPPSTESEKETENEKPIVFIGHGHSPAWRDLKDHLHEKHNMEIEAYETGARAGHTIRDILEDMVHKSSFALLVFTGEDEQSDGSLRARQNVIHEAGLFQGSLGFSRAILLLEEGVEEFSNVQGIQYIRFPKNKIIETYGDVIATINREFPK